MTRCKYEPRITPEGREALSWLVGTVDKIAGKPGHVNCAKAIAAREALFAVFECCNTLHNAAHKLEAQVEKMTAALAIANRRCDTLELILNDGEVDEAVSPGEHAREAG